MSDDDEISSRSLVALLLLIGLAFLIFTFWDACKSLTQLATDYHKVHAAEIEAYDIQHGK